MRGRRKFCLRFILLATVPALMMVTESSCRHGAGSAEQLREEADSFATNYYNWHFKKALSYCTPESEKWLRFAASNVHKADVDLLRAKNEDAKIELGDISWQDNDTLATIEIKVSDFLQMDSIGKAAHLIPEARFHLSMVMRNGKWMVKMGGPLRSEKQSRD